MSWLAGRLAGRLAGMILAIGDCLASILQSQRPANAVSWLAGTRLAWKISWHGFYWFQEVMGEIVVVMRWLGQLPLAGCWHGCCIGMKIAVFLAMKNLFILFKFLYLHSDNYIVRRTAKQKEDKMKFLTTDGLVKDITVNGSRAWFDDTGRELTDGEMARLQCQLSAPRSARGDVVTILVPGMRNEELCEVWVEANCVSSSWIVYESEIIHASHLLSLKPEDYPQIDVNSLAKWVMGGKMPQFVFDQIVTQLENKSEE